MKNLNIAFLGGVDEFGENLTCYYDDEHGFLIDFGSMFPEIYQHGVNYFYPDYHFLLENQEKFTTLFVTHGHEDHIGGIVNLVNKLPLKIIASAFTVFLIKNKLAFQKNIAFYPEFIVAEDLSVHQIGDFKIQFIENDHSIIDSYSLSICHQEKSIFHSSDFKIDESSEKTQKFLKNLKKYCENSDIALIDSTNASVHAEINLSERKVKESLSSVIESAEKNVFITLFSSNMERVASIISIVNKLELPLVFLGRSVDRYIEVAEEVDVKLNKRNIITVPEYLETLKEDASQEKTVFIVSGSQGELTSALTSIAYHQYRGVFLNEGDTVVYSSKTIPGNEKNVLKVKNYLLKKKVQLITIGDDSNIHSSGHSNARGIKQVLEILKPKYLIPIHGTLMQQEAVQQLSKGIENLSILIPELGDVFTFNGKSLEHTEQIEVTKRFQDVTGLDDMGYGLVKQRDKLKLGVAIISLLVDKQDAFVFKRPQVELDGFVDEKYNNGLKNKLEEVVFQAIENISLNKEEELKNTLQLTLKRYFRKHYHVSPKIFILVDYI